MPAQTAALSEYFADAYRVTKLGHHFCEGPGVRRLCASSDADANSFDAVVLVATACPAGSGAMFVDTHFTE